MRKNTPATNPLPGHNGLPPGKELTSTHSLLKVVHIKGVCQCGQLLLSYAADITQNKYLYLVAPCAHVLGYPVRYLRTAGPVFYKKLMHPADRHIYENHLEPQIVQFLAKQKEQDRATFSFTFNYRIKAAHTNTWLQVVQSANFSLHPVYSHPVYEAGYITDITHFKGDTKMVFVIERLAKQEKGHYKEILQKTAFHPQNQLFSRREKEILQLILEGKGSKQIAEKLFVSINTINNHRKNMLHKTGTKNFVQLINYAINHSVVCLACFVYIDYPMYAV